MNHSNPTIPVTVGKLLMELKAYEDKYFDYVVACRGSEDTACGIFGFEVDDEDDLCLHVEAMTEEGNIDNAYYDVGALLETLRIFNKDMKVYLAGCGQLWRFEPCGGSILQVDEDEESVYCFLSDYDDYEDEPEEMPDSAPGPEEERSNRGETMALIAIMAGSLVLVFYKAYALITGTGSPVWESILYIIGASIAAAVCGGTLRYSKERK